MVTLRVSLLIPVNSFSALPTRLVLVPIFAGGKIEQERSDEGDKMCLRSRVTDCDWFSMVLGHANTHSIRFFGSFDVFVHASDKRASEEVSLSD